MKRILNTAMAGVRAMGMRFSASSNDTQGLYGPPSTFVPFVPSDNENEDLYGPPLIDEPDPDEPNLDESPTEERKPYES